MTTEQLVQAFLASRGLTVTPLEVRSKKTPDFRVTDDAGATYLVEVKDKQSSVESEKNRADTLTSGGTWDEEDPLRFINTVSSVVRDACRQLAAFEPDQPHFRLLWLHAKGRHPDFQLEQFQATIGGVVNLIDTAEIATRPVPFRRCYYFEEAAFYRHRDVLDGAFISTDQRGALILNPMSPRYASFRTSGLCIAVPKVCDPFEEEREGKAYVADCDYDRSDSEAVLGYVKQKYGRPGLTDVSPTLSSAERVSR